MTDADVAAQVRRIGARVRKALKKAGKWWDEGDAVDEGEVVEGEQQTMLTLASGAVIGRSTLGERAGQVDVRVGRGTRAEPFVKGPLCADHDGFSLHAGVRVAAGDRKRLEHLLRYAGRPAIAESRLSLLPDGRVAYALKRRWKDARGERALNDARCDGGGGADRAAVGVGEKRAPAGRVGAAAAASPGDVSRCVGAGGWVAFAGGAAGG